MAAVQPAVDHHARADTRAERRNTWLADRATPIQRSPSAAMLASLSTRTGAAIRA